MADYEARMKLWIDSAKTSSQLATAAMFLPVFYTRELVATGKDKPLVVALDPSFIKCWIAFVVAIALAHTYQITATKLIETSGTLRFPLFPRVQYWMMVLALVVGMLFFVKGAMHTKVGTIQPPAAGPSAPQ